MSDNEEALIAAALANDVEEIRRLKNIGTDLDAEVVGGMTALEMAAFNGKKDAIGVLASLGADVAKADKDGITPLWLAAKRGHDDTVKLLHFLGSSVTTPSKRGTTPVQIAAEHGHITTVTVLESLGADMAGVHNVLKEINKRALFDAAAFNRVEEIEHLHKFGADLDVVTATKYADDMPDAGTSVFFIACWFGHAQAAEALAKLGADTKKGDAGGRSPLFAAAFRGKSAVVHLLLEMGTTENGRRGGRGGGGVNEAVLSDGTTLTWLAAGQGHNDTIKLLHSKGADVNQANREGCTPLHIAAQNGNNDTISLLHGLGGSVTQGDNNDATPLCYAAQEGRDDTISLLYSLGGSATGGAGGNGQTPLSRAISNQHRSTVTLLRGLGATLPTEQLDLVTVADVVNFFEVLGLSPSSRTGGLPAIVEKIRAEKVDAAQLFAVPDAEAMDKLLGPFERESWGPKFYIEHEGWGPRFFNIVQAHKSLQGDRGQATGASARAAEALQKMDNPAVRCELFELQRELFVEYSKTVFPSLVTGGANSSLSSTSASSSLSSSPLPPVKAATVEAALSDSLEQIAALVKQEEARLDGEVTATCLAKYQALKERWAYLEKLPTIAPEDACNAQPVANLSYGIQRDGQCDASPFGSTGGSYPLLERLEHLVALSKAVNACFQRQMEKVTDAVNEALNPQSLGLGADDFVLPFNEDWLAPNGKRATLSFGPIKRTERALKKAREYGEFVCHVIRGILLLVSAY